MNKSLPGNVEGRALWIKGRAWIKAREVVIKEHSIFREPSGTISLKGTDGEQMELKRKK